MSDANPPIEESAPSSSSSGGISITTTVMILGALVLAWYAYRKFFKE